MKKYVVHNTLSKYGKHVWDILVCDVVGLKNRRRFLQKNVLHIWTDESESKNGN